MSQKVGKHNNKVYKVVLTGGPCGGKTTGQVRLCSFFENIGWKVYRVPEAANTLLCGGVKFTSLCEEEIYKFQENLVKTMLQLEETFFELASTCNQNCLVICDRGVMDATAYMKPGQWDRMKETNEWNEVEVRDSRYNQVIHMVSSALGAEKYYSIDGHGCRSEELDFARALDQAVANAWVGHPYYDVIDNTTDFERKLSRMIDSVCNRLGIDVSDRLGPNSKKRKFLIRSTPPEEAFEQFQDFIVVHDYLVTLDNKQQARVRRRGQHGHWTYTHTIRKSVVNADLVEIVESKVQISSREYKLLIAQRDNSHYTVYKKRRCFLWGNQYFQLDFYQPPCPAKCDDLIILETYTAKSDNLDLPYFLEVEKEITTDKAYSMYNLSKKSDSSFENKTNSVATHYSMGNSKMNGTAIDTEK
ncbi:DgyrCDS9586 [Dimorphilus gyrociliatus]|uniref:DgyrCDS9586 n=1 Tax=Dimorphilus gyrociliatus TaxID=2664684 RepID=A0A7I8W048_9ANNE|nr:DgyrCDS9586 [Dimorphilus gyrociliatus]